MRNISGGIGIDALIQVVEQSPVSIVITNVSGTIQYVNPSFVKSTGYTRQELIGETPSLLKSGIHTQLFYKNMWETILKGQLWKGEILNRNKKGGLFWESLTISPIRNGNGEIIHLVGSKENISDRKHAQEEFLNEKLSFRNLAETASIIICQFDKDGTIIYSNKNYQDTWTRSEKIFAPLSPTEKAKLERGIDFVFSKSETTTEQIVIEEVGQEDRTYLVRISPIIIDGNVDSSIFVAHDISELLTERNSARHYRKQIQLLAENVADVIWMMDRKGKLDFVTPSIKAFSGYTVKEFLDFGFYGQVFKGLTKHINNVVRIADKDHVEHWESKFRKKNNDSIWVEIHGKAILSEDGVVTGVVGTMRDISERKAFEQKILRSERKFRAFFENTNACILVVDTELKAIVDVNKAAVEFYGYKPHEFYKLDIKHEMVGLLEASIEEASMVFLDMRNVYTQRHCLKNGGHCDVEIFPGSVEIEGKTLVYSIVQDVSQRKKAIEALKESESKKLALLKIIPELIFILNKNCEIVDVYTDEPKHLAVSPLKILGKHISYLFPKGLCEKLNDAVYEALSKQEIQMFDYRYKKDGGRYVVEEIRVISSGQEEVLAIIRDVTDQKNTEMELKRAWEEAKEAEKIKSSFLANMSHEIRTPINAILGFGELLQNEVDKPEQAQFIDSILSSSRTLLNLINDLLDFSKIEAGKMTINKENINLRTLLSEIEPIFSIQQKEKGLELKVDIEEELPEFICSDELRLRQILINLIENAIKFTHKGGVYVTVSSFNPRYIDNKSSVDLKLEVRDTGIGIPENNLVQIFDAFKQQEMQDARKYGGTGLGLAITKNLLSLLNGDIQVVSKEGFGSCFTATLYDVEVESEQVELLHSINHDYFDDKVLFEPATILIVDDVENNRALLKRMFKNSPIRILEAENDLEAITLLKYNPKIAILNMKMPQTGGLEVARYMKTSSEFAHISIVGISETDLTINDERNVYLDELISRPIIISKFLEKLCVYLECKKSPNFIQAEDKVIELAKENGINKTKLRYLFEEFLTPVYEEVSKTSSFTDYDRFANLLLERSEEFGLRELSFIGMRLKNAAKSFDLERINKLLADYSFFKAEVFKTDE